MHELSIALSLVDAACEEAEHQGGARVCALHVRLGALCGVVREALLFSFDLATAHTPIEGARLEIEDVPVSVLCPTCGVERELASVQHMRCPICGTPTSEVVHGRELQLYALEVEDEGDDAFDAIDPAFPMLGESPDEARDAAPHR